MHFGNKVQRNVDLKSLGFSSEYLRVATQEVKKTYGMLAFVGQHIECKD